MSWKNLNDRQKMNKSVLIYKILNNHSAPNLKDTFTRRDTNLNNYNLRSASTNLSLPKSNTEYLKKFWVLWCCAMEQPTYGGKVNRILNQVQKPDKCNN